MEQKERKVRIAISGAAGSGKTTLAQDLAKRLQLPVLHENWVSLAQAKAVYLAIISNESIGAEKKRKALGDWKLAYKTWLDARYKEQSQLNGYVSDRWAADAYSDWLRAFMKSKDDGMALNMLKAMRTHSKMYDFFILLPVTAKIAEERNTENLRRDPSLHIRIMANALTAGLITHFLKRPIIEVPSSEMSREERVEYVLERTELG
jgi:hypothetical protein